MDSQEKEFHNLTGSGQKLEYRLRKSPNLGCSCLSDIMTQIHFKMLSIPAVFLFATLFISCLK